MKTYKVAVNDKEYIVKLEEIGEENVAQPVTTKPEPKPEIVAKPEPEITSTSPAASADAEVIEAPLQGSVLSVNITAGQTVKTGDIVLIIEAMKLENEVVAPRDGVIDQVFIKEGQTVNAEDALYSLK